MKHLFSIVATSVMLLAVEPTLQRQLKSAHLHVAPKALQDNEELVTLMVETRSLTTKEKQYWLTALPTLADEQINHLTTILRTEKQKLAELEKQYQEESHQLDIKHSREWIEKLDELVTRPQGEKPRLSFLLAGLDMIDFYLANGNIDEPLKKKMLTVTDAILSHKKLSAKDKAHTLQTIGMIDVIKVQGDER